MSEFEINEFSLHLGHTDPDNEVGELMLDPATLSNMAHNQQHPGFDANLTASWVDGALQPLNDAATQPDFFGPHFEFYTDQNAILSNFTGADVGTGPSGFGQASSSYSFIDNSSYNILGDGDVESIYQGSFDFHDDVNQLPFAQNTFNFQASHNLSVASGLTQDIPVVSAQHHLSQKQQRKAKKKSSSQRKKPRKRTTFDWADAKPYLQRLYIEQDHTIAEVSFVMAVLYSFTATSSTLQKKLSGELGLRKNNRSRPASDLEKADRRRPAQSYRARLVNQSATLAMRYINSQAPMTIVPGRPYGDQELMLHSIDVYTRGLFGAGDNSWTYNDLDFVPPPGVSTGYQAWSELETNWSNIDYLANWGLHKEVNSSLTDLLAYLKQEAVARYPGPHFLVYFWKVCLIVIDIRTGSSVAMPFLFLKLFLHEIRGTLQHFLGKHPLVDIVQSLLNILDLAIRQALADRRAFSEKQALAEKQTSPKKKTLPKNKASSKHKVPWVRQASPAGHLTHTIGIAYWKSIHILGEMIGRDHRIILNMQSNCAKHWKGKFEINNKILKKQYDNLKDHYDNFRTTVNNPKSNFAMEQWIAVLSDSTYSAARKKGSQTKDILKAAIDLWRLTEGHCRAQKSALTFNQTTRAFVLAANLLAGHHLAESNKFQNSRNYDIISREEGIKYLSSAADTLGQGDVTCLILAADFSKLLAGWTKPNRQTPQARFTREADLFNKERIRSRDLLKKVSRILDTRSRKSHVFEYEAISLPQRHKNDWRKERIISRDRWLSRIGS